MANPDFLMLGDYGIAMQITMTEDGAAKDVSAADTLTFKAKGPTGSEKSWAASFQTDGTDGILTYTLANGDIDEAGEWKIRAIAVDTGVYQYQTKVGLFLVLTTTL